MPKQQFSKKLLNRTWAEYTGPRSDQSIQIRVPSGQPTGLLCASVRVQCSHSSEGSRILRVAISRDGDPHAEHEEHFEFSQGRADITSTVEALAQAGLYILTFKVINEQQGPVYTGIPHIEAMLEALLPFNPNL